MQALLWTPYTLCRSGARRFATFSALKLSHPVPGFPPRPLRFLEKIELVPFSSAYFSLAFIGKHAAALSRLRPERGTTIPSVPCGKTFLCP